MRNEFDWYKWTVKPLAIAVLIMMMAAIFMDGVRADDDCFKAEDFPQTFVDNSKVNGYDVEILGTWEYAHGRGIFVQLADKSDPPRWYFYAVDHTGVCLDQTRQLMQFNEDEGADFIIAFTNEIDSDSGV